MSANPPTSRNSSPPAAESPALWPWLLAGAIGSGLLALWFPLWPHVGRVPPADLRTFAPTLFAGLLYALLLLKAQGYSDVKSVAGGMGAWTEAGLPVAS